MQAVFDTNILVDYLQGVEQARLELQQYPSPKISIITWIEILVGSTEDNIEDIRLFLNNFTVVDLDSAISEIAIQIRQKEKIKLPDAIIWATAKHSNSLLITRNTRDFPTHAMDVKVPYQL